MIRIHLEEGQWGAFDHRTLVTIVQRSEAKLGQAYIPRVRTILRQSGACRDKPFPSRTYIKVQRNGVELEQACIPRVLIIVRWARWGKW